MAVEDALGPAVLAVFTGESPHEDGLVTGSSQDDIGVLGLFVNRSRWKSTVWSADLPRRLKVTYVGSDCRRWFVQLDVLAPNKHTEKTH